MEDNFALALTVFIVGFVALLITFAFLILAHRYWESKDVTTSREADGDLE